MAPISHFNTRGCPLAIGASVLLMFAAAKPWFYWLAVLLSGSGVLVAVLLFVGYYVRVISQKSHRR